MNTDETSPAHAAAAAQPTAQPADLMPLACSRCDDSGYVGGEPCPLCNSFDPTDTDDGRWYDQMREAAAMHDAIRQLEGYNCAGPASFTTAGLIGY